MGRGRYIFAICCGVFGINHFIYFRCIATIVPAWIPGGGAFWTAVTRVAFLAAAVAIAPRRLDLLGANLLGLRFLL